MSDDSDAITLRDTLTRLNEQEQALPANEADEHLAQIREALEEDIQNAKLCYREIRHFIRDVASTTTNPSLCVQAAHLYLELLSVVAVSYDEVSLSACLFHVGKVIREVKTKCPKKCSRKTSICSQNGHVTVKQYSAFWLKLTQLLETNLLDGNNPAVLSLVLAAFANLLQYAKTEVLLEVAFDGFQALLESDGVTAITITTVCKVCFPLLRISLPAANRRVLQGLLVATVESEKRASAASQRQSSATEIADRDDEQVENGEHSNAEACTPSRRRSSAASRARNSIEPGTRRVIKFLEFCCVQSSDKADERDALANIVHHVLLQYDSDEARQFHGFLKRTANHPKTNVRMLAIDISAMIMKTQKEGNHADDILSFFVKLLASRAQDSMATVRAKAISSLAIFARALGQMNSTVIKELDRAYSLVLPRLRDEKARVRKSAVDFAGWTCQKFVLWGRQKDVLEAGVESASQLLSGVTPGKRLRTYMSNLKMRCSDASPIVRLAAIDHLTAALVLLPVNFFGIPIKDFYQFWLDGALPQVDDADSRCQEAALAGLGGTIFPDDDTMDVGEEATSRSPSALNVDAKHLLMCFFSHLSSMDKNARSLGVKALAALCRQGKIGKSEILVLATLLQTGKSDSSEHLVPSFWIALEAAALGGKAQDVKSVLGLELVISEITSTSNISACRIATKLVSKTNSKKKEKLAQSLRKSLFSNRRVSGNSDLGTLYSSIIELLAALRENLGDELLVDCESNLSERGEKDETKILLLHIIGAICMTFKLQKSPSDMLVTFVKAMTSNKQNSSRLRALAIGTLGKICLCESVNYSTNGNRSRNERQTLVSNQLGESLTRKLISVFVNELDNATSSATRNNAVIVLCDLCRQYTSVVEPFVARLASLLSDPSEFVRVQVLSSLVSLLQEDYMKIRTGALFYQIAKCLLDPSNGVKATAEYALLQVVCQKNASILAVSFVELIFVLNGCRECQLYNQFGGSEHIGKQIVTSSEQRSKIYEVFLRGMTPEQLIRLPGRFRSDIVTLMTEERISLDSPTVLSVLEDTLLLLCSERLSPFSRARGGGDTNEVSLEVAEMSQLTAAEEGENGVVVSKKASMIKKLQLIELRETTVPALLELRLHLEAKRSPLLGNLMKTLCTLLQPHRADLETMIVDPVVRAEVSHEMLQMQQNACKRPSALPSLSATNDAPADNENMRGVENRIKNASATPRASARKPPRGDPGSIARSGRPKRRRANTVAESSDDEANDGSDDDAAILQSARRGSAGRSLSELISASPKLAAIARRSSRLSEPAGVTGEASGFATAMARIEQET